MRNVKAPNELSVGQVHEVRDVKGFQNHAAFHSRCSHQT